MASEAAQPQLHMKRRLTDLPALTLPDGYRLRSLTPVDASAWAALLQHNGELREWDADRAAPFFAPDSTMPLDGSFFITTDDGAPVATAQLHLHRNDDYAPLPELGWVAADPAHRGKRLGLLACLAVLHYAADAGNDELFLRTDDHRLPAIVTYFRLGFEPWMVDESSPTRWQAIRQSIDAR
jgi:mycothiol synthase